MKANLPKYVTPELTGRDAHWCERYNRFADEAPITSADTVLLGDSLTENGGEWLELGWKNVRNRGIIGDDISGIGSRLHQILPGKPATIFLMVGVNDISHDLTTDEIVSQLAVLVDRIRKETPDTRLYLQSLLPINEHFGRYRRLTGKTSQVPEINARLSRLVLDKGVPFLHLFPRFCEPGYICMNPRLTTDGLHLNKIGYIIWYEQLNRLSLQP